MSKLTMVAMVLPCRRLLSADRPKDFGVTTMDRLTFKAIVRVPITVSLLDRWPVPSYSLLPPQLLNPPQISLPSALPPEQHDHPTCPTLQENILVLTAQRYSKAPPASVGMCVVSMTRLKTNATHVAEPLRTSGDATVTKTIPERVSAIWTGNEVAIQITLTTKHGRTVGFQVRLDMSFLDRLYLPLGN